MAGGAYIRIKDGNIYIHAPGQVEQKAAVHSMLEPTSLAKEMPRLPDSEMKIKQQFAILSNHSGIRMPKQDYKITLEDGTVYQGKTNDKGETEVIESHIPQEATIELFDPQTNVINSVHKVSLIVSDEDYTYTEDQTRQTNIGHGLLKNNNYCSIENIKLRTVVMQIITMV